ncbi:autotransporter domain-containing protein [Lysobacter sp. 5GHs7-4]|uniref:autotransporter family protein n=1 Tax=Lysobacter sp. 5GHs7-4 TaxID=2904253 RepID=UPI001E598F3F|nr:autotransporter domain-containing protein [Lysobacter sp. 5GHs7-4]UHQ22150.1 autotransporter domain-containing protein [Lysobacter sp. 5GHs7-4]
MNVFLSSARLWLLALALLASCLAASAHAQSLTPLPAGTAGRPYSATLSGSGGTPPYSFALENPFPYAMPFGLTLSSGGVISGTIRDIPHTGTSQFAVLATDANGATTRTVYQIEVGLAPVAISPAVLPAATQGQPYSQMLVASGGLAPYHFVSVGSACGPHSTPSSGCANFWSAGQPNQLPAGLRLESNGLITGTPTTFGDFTIYFLVLDNGWTGPLSGGLWSGLRGGYQSVRIRIEPHVLTLSPSELPKGRVGAPYDLQLETSGGNAPYRYYADHLVYRVDGLSLSESGRLSGIPTRAGTHYLQVLSVESGPRGASISRLYPIVIEAGATAASLSVNAVAGAPTTVMLTDGATGGPFTAASVVSIAPTQAGSAQIVQIGSGAAARFALTFTPDAYFSGVATLRYTLNAGAAVSSPGSITFNVAPRPNPGQDAEVRGLLRAQADSARRFASSQIGNFQQRLSRLHRGDAGGFSNGLSLSAPSACAQIDSPWSGPACDRARSSADATAAVGSAGAADAPQATAAKPDSALGLWTAGSIRRGDREGRDGSAGTDFESDGVSLGADYRYRDDLAFGAGLGYGRDDSEVGDQDSRSRAKALTLALYASYAPGDTYFVDGLLGYQHLSYELRRRVTANGALVRGDRDGSQWFGSISAGAELRRGELSFVPYARLDLARARLDAYAERGDPIYALAYEDLTVKTSTANLGLRLDYRHQAAWGTFSPQLRLEYQRDFQGNGLATIRYADLMSGPYYVARLGDFDRNRLLLGLGGSFALRNDWSFRIGYDTLLGSGGDSDRSLQLSIDKRY